MDDGSKPFYYLDTTVEQQDESTADKVIDFFDPSHVSSVVTGHAITDKAAASIAELKNNFANLVFRFDVFLTTALINGLKMAFDFNVIDQLINDKIESLMRGVAGVDSSGSYTNSGLMGSLMQFIAILSGLFGLFLFVGKRGQLGAFKSIGSTILVLVLASGFFANYGPFLKGMNKISTELSEVILIGPAKVLTMSDKPMDAIQDDLFGEIWDQFVNTPYLYMQYGTNDSNAIGKGRINELLKMKPDDQRLKYVQDKEVKERGNINMTYSNVDSRLIFTGFYSFFNFLNGIPFLLLMLGLVGTQFWFLAIACLSPFVFCWSAFPNQIIVLKRYGFYLALPLVVKILLTLATFIYFMTSKVVYSLNSTSLGGYVTSGFSMMAILFVLFLLRKPIMKIFGASKEFNLIYNEVREFKNAASQHMNSVSKLAGAALLGAAGAEIAETLIEKSEDVQQKKESYDPTVKAPNSDYIPPEIHEWRDIPDFVETTEEANVNTPDKIELAELPKWEMEGDEETKDEEAK